MQSHLSNEISAILANKASADESMGIKSKFEKDEQRANRFSKQLDDLFFDFSKSHIDQELVDTYLKYADEISLVAARKDFLAGEKINNTEERSVLHTLLRDSSNQGIATKEPSVLQEAKLAQQGFAEQFARIEQALDQRSKPIKDIIHVGIGGSSLGTQLLFEALQDANEHRQIHFIGNIDAHQLMNVFAKCDVQTTLVIGVSKTFTTAETLKNLDSICQWFKDNGVTDPLSNFFGVTANPEQASHYGLPDENVVTFPEWVGGRYSVWSSVSLSAALVLGKDRFDEFLIGAASMDKHFYQADLKDNVCFQAAILDHYYANYMDVGSKAIFAYDFRFRSLVDYLQQLETESNGKDRTRDGEPCEQKTSMVVWGGVGTDVQHSVFQMLHQGTSLIPSEFILVKTPDHDLTEHHNELLANGIAQTAALLEGQDLSTVEAIHGDEGLSDAAKKAKVFSGDRPSLTILLERLTPTALGALLAFYEHRVFFGGVLTNINSFDQMGVELGKRLAKQVRPLIDNKRATGTEFDPSTELLLSKLI
ncbi:glucose-6-phosphate isomerase [Arenicella sp. 4NH20-0111]|uniref:glucose-6-phosphate isomerase n=1 Tax=Arenicella sp. 4NH20-0111 TaxID=3127648 RepID=UPI003103C39E